MVAQFFGIFAVRKRREEDNKGRRRERRRKNRNGAGEACILSLLDFDTNSENRCSDVRRNHARRKW
jgi:hypothetical protein